jgi:transcriptional regulator with XRE-family HTH domain
MMTPEQIRDARMSLGLTRGRAALLFGVDPRTWRRWETGDREISPSVVKLIALCTTLPAAWEALQAMADTDGATEAAEALQDA